MSACALSQASSVGQEEQTARSEQLLLGSLYFPLKVFHGFALDKSCIVPYTGRPTACVSEPAGKVVEKCSCLTCEPFWGPLQDMLFCPSICLMLMPVLVVALPK